MSEVRTRKQLWGNLSDKEAEVSGTSLAPTGSDPDRSPKKDSLSFIPKSASVVPSRVNVTDIDPRPVIIEKIASRFCLPSQQKYPIDSFDQVTKAASYFDEFRGQFAPEQRREYCASLVKRASELGLKVSPTIQKYGSATYGTNAEIELGISSRMSVVHGSMAKLLDKVAAERPVLTPEYYAAALHEFDKIAGIDHLYDKAVVDPWYSTYGVKVAAEDKDDVYIQGNDVVHYSDVKKLALSPCAGMQKMFGDDFVQEFKKDPVGIFKSLPSDQKKLVGRMAQDVDIHYSVG